MQIISYEFERHNVVPALLVALVSRQAGTDIAASSRLPARTECSQASAAWEPVGRIAARVLAGMERAGEAETPPARCREETPQKGAPAFTDALLSCEEVGRRLLGLATVPIIPPNSATERTTGPLFRGSRLGAVAGPSASVEHGQDCPFPRTGSSEPQGGAAAEELEVASAAAFSIRYELGVWSASTVACSRDAPGAPSLRGS